MAKLTKLISFYGLVAVSLVGCTAAPEKLTEETKPAAAPVLIEKTTVHTETTKQDGHDVIVKTKTVETTTSFSPETIKKAQEHPKAYQATYKYSMKGVPDQHVSSDGAGHIRFDSTTPGVNSAVEILDLNTNQSTSWTEGIFAGPQGMSTKEFTRQTASPTDTFIGMRLLEISVPEKGKSLGAKNVKGHKCHGWKLGSGSDATEFWFDDDYSIPVEMKSEGVTRTLSAFSPKPPAPASFQPPADYTEKSN